MNNIFISNTIIYKTLKKKLKAKCTLSASITEIKNLYFSFDSAFTMVEGRTRTIGFINEINT